MAEIHEDLVLNDHASSTVDKYIQKMTSAATTTEKTTRAMTASEFLAQRMGQQYSIAAEMMSESEKVAQSAAEKNEAQIRKEEMAQARLEAARQRSIAATMQAEAATSRATAANTRAEEATIRNEIAKTRLAEAESRAEKAASQAATAQLRNQQAQEKAAAAHERAARAAEQQEKKTSRLVSVMKGLSRNAKGAVSSLLGLGQAGTPLDGVTSKITKMAASLFTVRKLFQYMKDALAVAPDEIASSFTDLGNTIKTDFQRVFGAMLKSIQPGLDKLRAALEAPGGQRFLKGLQAMAETAGRAVGWLAAQVGTLIEWIGNNWNAVMPVAIGLLGLFAAKMLIAAAATLAAHWPLMLIITIIAGVVTALSDMGVTASEVFGTICGLINVTIAFFTNLGQWIANVAAGITEALIAMANNVGYAFDHMGELVVIAMNKMAAAALRAFKPIIAFIGNISGVPGMGNISNLFDQNGLNTAAAELEAAAAQSWSGISGGFQDVGAAYNRGYSASGNTPFADGWADKAYAEGYKVGEEAGKAIENLVNTLANPQALDQMALQDIKVSADSSAGSLGGIGASVANIEKEVAMSQEDIKHLADIAERRYVNHINLTSQTPVINITGQNTGRMQDDANSLARKIAQVLVEQTSAGATRSIVFP